MDHNQNIGLCRTRFPSSVDRCLLYKRRDIVAPQFAVQAFAADGLVGTARLVAAYGNGLLGFAGDAFVDGSLSFVIVGACVFVVRALAAAVVARVARIFAAAFGYLLAVFAAGDCCLEFLVFGTCLDVIKAFAAVSAFFVTGNGAAGTVYENTLYAFLDNADTHGTVGAGAFVAVVAFAFAGRDRVRAFLVDGIADGADVADFFATDADSVFFFTARGFAELGKILEVFFGCFGRTAWRRRFFRAGRFIVFFAAGGFVVRGYGSPVLAVAEVICILFLGVDGVALVFFAAEAELVNRVDFRNDHFFLVAARIVATGRPKRRQGESREQKE